MPLSRLVGYYCLLLLLCSVVFARWLPLDVSLPADTSVTLSCDAPAPLPAPVRVSLRPASALLLLRRP